jgi:predicted O-methyltransferase YrrM
MDIVNPQVERYMRSLLERYDHPVLNEMEAQAERRSFPAVGRMVGVTLELLARSIGATRVFELGSGFGYSAYWFARAAGGDGEIHCTDDDPTLVQQGKAFLAEAGLGSRVTWHLGDALGSFAETEGTFDVVFVDINKTEYPGAWRAASGRIRLGGLYIADNTIAAGNGNVFGEGDVADAMREHNRLIAGDERYISTIVPTREGVLTALRIA